MNGSILFYIQNTDFDLYTVQSEGPQQCQSYPYVFFYELYTIVADSFTKARYVFNTISGDTCVNFSKRLIVL